MRIFVAAATVPREGLAADQELRDPMLANIEEDIWRFVFLSSSILLLEKICVRDLVVATDLWAADQMIRDLGLSSRQLSVNEPEEDDTVLIPESPGRGQVFKLLVELVVCWREAGSAN